MRNKTKKTLKGIGLGVLGVATLIGAAATINHFKADEDGLVKVHLNYDIGGLDSNGEYEETEESIYTKKAFESQGLKVEVDFDSTINYEVFFYNQYGDFIKSTGVLEKNFDSDIPLNATHARIEITPQEDEDGVKWYEKSGYANQISVKVNKEQKNFFKDNKLVVDSTMQGKIWNLVSGSDTELRIDENSPNYVSFEVVDVSGADEITFALPTTLAQETHLGIFMNDTKTSSVGWFTLNSKTPEIVGDYSVYTIAVPEDASYFVINGLAKNVSDYYLGII